MRLKPLPLKPCPYCAGKMEIKQSWDKEQTLREGFAKHSYSIWDPTDDLSLIPTCTICKTQFPKVSVSDFLEDVYNMMMTKIVERWQ